MTLLALWLALVMGSLLAQTPPPGQNPFAPDTPEPGSVEAIAKYTTEPRFGNQWVAYLPDSATVPSPTKFLGHVVGAPGELSSTTKIYGYFRALAGATPRVRVEVIGRSDEGRDILLVAVADEEGIRNLAALKAATAALADPRKTSPGDAERLIASARPIYYFNAGLHSSETGSPEMVMELAYRLAVSNQPMIQAIRRNVLILINPVAEPDGRDRFVEWFYRHLKGRTDYENMPETSPPYWGHYVYHDNNRDSHQAALETTRAVQRMFFDYHPTAVHDLHESVALLQTWNGTGPFNPNLDPIVVSEFFEMSFAEVTALTRMGMPGVWTWGFGEGFGHHYTESIATNHNSIGRGYETFGNATAETVERNLRDRRYVGRPVTESEWYRPLPPPRKFTWSLRNNTNYMESGCLAILNYVAATPKEALRNFYRKGYNSWQKGKSGKPYAFVIPADQGDRRRVAELINLLRRQRIEVGRAIAPITVTEGEFPAGSFVVPLDQPYRNYAVDLLTPQKFPADAEYQPYDDISWALPVHYGLEAKRIDDQRIAAVALDPVVDEVLPAGAVRGSGPVFLLKDTGQEALLAARARLARFAIGIAEQPFKVNGADYPAGSWIVQAQEGVPDALRRVAEEFGLDFESIPAPPDVSRHDAKLPRLAVWHPWSDSQMTGWIRLTFDRERIPYTYIRDEEIRAGDLRRDFDVILYGDVSGDLKEQIHGIDTKFGPLAYTRTPEFPSHGQPDASDDITGGIGWRGMANLQRFLDEGGVLITLGNASVLALDGGLVRNVRHAPGESSVWTPGVELTVKFTRPDHPLAYGYPVTTSAFRGSYPVFDVRPADRRWVVLQWGTRPPKEDRAGAEGDEPAPGERKEKDEVPLVVSGGA
ncbi:MAG: peptidase, partial [Acidobacteria bacterium]|nr:peptidase [Acidobacteriota bacterium]